jgi:hypothetical protein
MKRKIVDQLCSRMKAAFGCHFTANHAAINPILSNDYDPSIFNELIII